MRVLVVEDDQVIATAIAAFLRENGFAVDVSFEGEDGLFQAENETYDCIVLDISLPKIDGFTIAQRLREKKNTTPILILTAYDATADKVKGFSLGADDYLTKPFAMVELLARVQALIRRNTKEPLPVLKIADLMIDPLARTVKRGRKNIDLPSKEFAVLEFLARHSGEVVTRTMILDHVWGSEFETMSNVIDVYIRNLRKKIDTSDKKSLIYTIRGGGYRLGDS